MNIHSKWRTVLKQYSFDVEHSYPTSNTDPDDELPTLMDLTGISVIEVTGDDAEVFLQGQLTNDLSQLTTGHAQLSAYCNPKGRVFAVLRVIRTPNGFLLNLPCELTHSFLKRLSLYVLRAKAKLLECNELILLGLHAKEPFDYGLMNVDLGDTYNGQLSRQLLLCTLEQAENLLENRKHLMEKNTLIADYRLWRLHDIRCGLAQVFLNTQEVFVPQMINLDLVNGISFDKGCYPGQEIIARLRYLGKLKQRMIRAQVSTTEAIKAGDAVYVSEHSGQKSGQVVDALSIGPGSYQLLCTIPITHLEAGDLFLDQNLEIRLERQQLPYSFTGST